MSRITAALVVALLAGCAHTSAPPRPQAEQSVAQRANEQMRLAEEASERGDLKAASELYRSALQLQPSLPRAMFRLGQLAPAGSTESIRYLRRYTELQPRNPSGYMALGDTLAKAGAFDEALAQYGRARTLSPDDPKVLSGEVNILRAAGRIDVLIRRLGEETARRPYDANAWIELGRARQRAGQHAEAAQAFRRAHEIEPSGRASELMDASLSRAAPSVRPYAGGSEDSDKNRVKRVGVDLLLPVGRTRVGISAERAQISDPLATGTADRIALPVQWLPNHAWRVDTSTGIVRLQPAGQKHDDRLIADAGVRWRPSIDSPAAEFRLSHQPLLASPRLLAHPVELTQARAMLEVPLTRHWTTRLYGEGARFDEPNGTNTRVGGRAGLGFRVFSGLEFQASAGTLGYERPSTAGYSSPKRSTSGEVGVMFEVSRLWPLHLSVDTAVGTQRITQFATGPSPWKGTFRWSSSLGLELWPGAELALDVEHDNTLEQRAVDTDSDQWRSTAVLLSLRFGVRRQDRAIFTAPQTPGIPRRDQ